MPPREALDERYRTILQNIQGYAIYAVDPQGRVTDWTDGAQRIKGYAPSEVIGLPCDMFHTPEARAAGEPAAILEEAARMGRAEHESWHVRKDGSRFWAHEIAAPIRDADGRLLGFTKVSRDMTVHRMLEQRQEESLAKEREAREAAEAFMAVMSHELRTPVTTIYGTASLLKRDPQRPDTRELLADIEDEAERLLRIVDDLLVLSRVERGAVVLTVEPVVVRHVVTDVLAVVGRRYPSARIEVEGSVAMPALADATALRQVIHNLLTNAAKYAGADGTIVVRLSEDRGWARIEVLDRGPGLGSQPEDLFQLFHRSPSAARMAPGSGIGLYVARQLVRAMGGSIEAGTRPEGGARFEVRLPLTAEGDDGL
ncbi:MAG: PAS domain-containing sensor histidine kinase [Chloroflexota bacterium]